MSEQIRHFENLRATTASAYRSSKVAFSYYILGIAIALLSFLINIMKLEDFANWYFKFTIVFLLFSIVSGILSIYKDVEINKNEYTRINALIESRENDFNTAVSEFYNLNKSERFFNRLSKISLLISLLLCVVWKLYSINVL